VANPFSWVDRSVTMKDDPEAASIAMRFARASRLSLPGSIGKCNGRKDVPLRHITPASARKHQEDGRSRELPLMRLSSGPYRREGFLSDETIVVTEHPFDV
jgi:hypothetical protein